MPIHFSLEKQPQGAFQGSEGLELVEFSTGKGKVVSVLNYAPRHEDILGEWRYSSTHSLISALDGGEWSASRLGRFISRERAPGTH
jgi:hypothetical protein